MLSRASLLSVVTIIVSGLSLPVKAATFDVEGTVNLNGHIINVGSSALLNFTIEGPITGPLMVGYSLSENLSGAPDTTQTTIGTIPFITAVSTANINGA